MYTDPELLSLIVRAAVMKVIDIHNDSDSCIIGSRHACMHTAGQWWSALTTSRHHLVYY